MLSMYGIIVGEVILGIALMVLLFASHATAETIADSSSQSDSKVQSHRSETPMQSETEMTNTTGQSSDPSSRYTVMPIAREEQSKKFCRPHRQGDE